MVRGGTETFFCNFWKAESPSPNAAYASSIVVDKHRSYIMVYKIEEYTQRWLEAIEEKAKSYVSVDAPGEFFQVFI